MDFDSSEDLGEMPQYSLAFDRSFTTLEAQDETYLQQKLPLVDEQQEAVDEVFDKFDKDGDGHITESEISSVLHELGIDKQEALSKATKILERFDQDNDGKIDKDEFTSFMVENLTLDLQNIFKVFDRDENGKISAEEVKHILTFCGEPITDEESRQIIGEFDRDNDGNIDILEFTKAMETREDPLSRMLAQNLHRTEEIKMGIIVDTVMSISPRIPRVPRESYPELPSDGAVPHSSGETNVVCSGGAGEMASNCKMETSAIAAVAREEDPDDFEDDGDEDEEEEDEERGIGMDSFIVVSIAEQLKRLRAVCQSSKVQELVNRSSAADIAVPPAPTDLHNARFAGALPDDQIHPTIPRVPSLKRSRQTETLQPSKKKVNTVNRVRGRPRKAPSGWLFEDGGPNSHSQRKWDGLSRAEQLKIQEEWKTQQNSRNINSGKSNMESTSASTQFEVPSLNSISEKVLTPVTAAELNILSCFEVEDFTLLESLTSQLPINDEEFADNFVATESWEQLLDAREKLQRWFNASTKSNILHAFLKAADAPGAAEEDKRWQHAKFSAGIHVTSKSMT